MKVDIDVERRLNDGTYAYYTTKLRLASLGQRLVYLQRQLLAFNLLKELQGRRGMSKAEVELYFIYLDLYLDPAVQRREREAFHSSFKLTRLIAARCADIEKQAHKKFLARQQKNLFSTITKLIDQKLIVLEDPKREREKYPALFSNVIDKRRRTHKKTLQPEIVFIRGGASLQSQGIRNYLEDETYSAKEADREYAGMMLFYSERDAGAIPLPPEDVHDLLSQILLEEFCLPSSDSRLSKKLNWFYRAIFDDTVLVKSLQYQCLKYLNGMFFADEDMQDLLLVLDEYSLDDYARTYGRLRKIKMPTRPKRELPIFSPAEMLRLREADRQAWSDVWSDEPVSGDVPSRSDTARQLKARKELAQRNRQAELDSIEVQRKMQEQKPVISKRRRTR